MSYHRTALAEEMARQILHPQGLMETPLQAGVFLSGPRRIGKTTFGALTTMPSPDLLARTPRNSPQ